MSSAIAAPQAMYFADDGQVPNHPYYPALLYRQVCVDAEDLAAAFEARFAANHWPAAWRDTIYPYQHFHAGAHEAVGLVRGHARLRLGGNRGLTVEVVAGDVLVLPAGTGHRRLAASDDLQVVGAYPRGSDVDQQRVCATAERPRLQAMILAVAHPGYDPVGGRDGALSRLWPVL